MCAGKTDSETLADSAGKVLLWSTTRRYDQWIRVIIVAVDKFSISLPADLVADIDDIARAEGLSRSTVIREAAAHYVVVRKSATYEEERKLSIDRAIAGFDRIAREWGTDERSSLDLLREVREESLGGARQDARKGARRGQDAGHA